MRKCDSSRWPLTAGAWVAFALALGMSQIGCTVDFTGPGNQTDGGEEGCGNGLVEPGEVCDGSDFGGQDCLSVVGRTMGTLICTPSCGLDLSGCHDCGNGVTDSDETCDDTNAASEDGCDQCQVEDGWTCSGEPSVCATVCGDGLVVGVEACDDENTVSGDGCTGGCESEAGWVCSGEPSVCAQTCGNGALDPGEACDDGNLIFDDGCSPSCVVDAGYECTGTPSVCEPECGDGMVLPGEACDDGNSATGDGCLDDCTVEAGWDCDFTADPPQGCVPICGDGLLLGGEQCDDDNTQSWDGCSNTCQVEAYSACDGEPSQCICVVYVDRDTVPGTGNGQTWTTAYERIDDAINEAASRRPCEIWVAEGTYYIYRTSSTDRLNLRDDSMLYGGFDGTETWRAQRDWLARPTVISGEQEGDPTNRVRQIFVGNGDTNVTIDGFTITRADAVNDRGGGMELDNNSSVTMRRVVFTGNHAEHGAAIYVTGGSAVYLTDATFLGNNADNDGGAIYGNNWGTVVINRCLFQGNQAGQDGGAVWTNGPDLNVDNSRFLNNIAGDYGGAIAFSDDSFVMTSSLLTANHAGQGGGAVELWQTNGTPTVVNCTFFENTTSPGDGQAIRVAVAQADVLNSILWGSTTDQIFENMANVDVDYCNVMGGASGNGNISQPPLFVNASGGDFRLSAGSPGIDAGSGFAAPATDIDDNPRADDPNTFNSGVGNPAYVDMGAYEYQP